MNHATLRIVPRGFRRDDYLPLLRLADDAEIQIRAYYQDGDLYVLEDRAGAVLGLVLVVPRHPGEVELKSVAVAPDHQRRGVGTRMLRLVLTALSERGVVRVVVGTASSSVGVLAFYQRVGFRLASIERDYFTLEKGYPAGAEEDGIPLRDMVWMDRRP
jgi:ribosomal protein S18 acetylase RimI-like enzyme